MKQKALKAIAWQSGAKIITQVFSVVVTIFLARELQPTDFGLVGMALIFTGFLDLIGEFGIGSSIIHKKSFSKEELDAIFWVTLIAGLSMFFVGALSAPLVGDFYRNDEVPVIIKTLSLGFIINSLRVVPYSILTKELKFDKRSKAEITSSLVGGGVAFGMAFTGFGVWALVLNSLAQGVCLTLMIFWYAQWRPSLPADVRNIKSVIDFGMKVMVARVLWYAQSNADFLIVGRVLGEKLLGYYSMAFRLATLPTEKISAVINQVMFPTFSIIQDDRERVRIYFLKTTKYVAILTFPVLTAMFIMAEEIVTLLLTDKWLPIIFPLKALLIVGAIKSVDVIIPQVLMAKGKAGLLLKYNIALVVVLPVCFLIGCYLNGVNGVAYSWLISYPILVTSLFYAGLKEMRISFREYLRNLTPQIIGTALMAAIMLASKAVMSLYFSSSLLAVLTVLAVSACSFVLYFYYYQTAELDEIISSVRGSR